MTFQTDQAKKLKRKATKRAEAALIAGYGRLASVSELDAVLDEKLGAYPEQRSAIRAYVQRLVPHLRDTVH